MFNLKHLSACCAIFTPANLMEIINKKSRLQLSRTKNKIPMQISLRANANKADAGFGVSRKNKLPVYVIYVENGRRLNRTEPETILHHNDYIECEICQQK